MFNNKALMSMIVLAAVWVMSCNQSTNNNNGPNATAQSNVRPTPSSTNITPTPSSSPTFSNQPISITTPANEAQVTYREIIRGTITDPKSKVWVIVRPMSGSDYWVQPPVDVEQDGKWSVQVYFGKSETANIGERFKVMAVANPVKELKEANQLKGWPEAKWQSQIIEVIRK